MKIQNFYDVINHLKKQKNRPISLLMGNGFSVGFDNSIFTYNALAKFLSSKADPLINKLFDAVKTTNFEVVMRQLDATISLLESFNVDQKIIDQMLTASKKLKEGLIKSIQEMHPEHVFKVADEKSLSCANFLTIFLSTEGHLFTTNYDLLLYWILLRNNLPDHIDGFGKELINQNFFKEDEEPEYSELIWGPNSENQNVHYLHGALHIFDARIKINKEKYDFDNYLLDNIKRKLDSDKYPIFVTAGSGDEKLAYIRNNRYLNFCYEKLCNLNGSLLSFGFNFGEYDEHIIEALNKAHHANSKSPPKLWSVYIGIYSEQDFDHIKSIEHKFHAPLRIFDAKTANVWS